MLAVSLPFVDHESAECTVPEVLTTDKWATATVEMSAHNGPLSTDNADSRADHDALRTHKMRLHASKNPLQTFNDLWLVDKGLARVNESPNAVAQLPLLADKPPLSANEAPSSASRARLSASRAPLSASRAPLSASRAPLSVANAPLRTNSEAV
jgi:hypothetical protein